MAFSRAEIKKFATLIANNFLEGKDTQNIRDVSQDAIDTFVIPIMTKVEDVANELIAQKLVELQSETYLNEEDDFWPSIEQST